MADFRKYALAFAGVAGFLGVTGSASAQSFTGFTCTANAATPFQMRAEGITEQAGDIVLSCTGGTATPTGSLAPQVNITVSLNTQVTSRLVSSTNNLTDAVLLINDPAPGLQSLCLTPLSGCPLGGAGTGGASGGAQYKVAGTFNTYEGVLTQPNQLTFFGVPIDPPGPTVTAGTVPTLTLRVTNVRANASSLGAPTGFSATSVIGSISTSAGFNITSPTLTVGSVLTGLLPGIVSGGVTVTPFVSGYSTSSTATLTALGLQPTNTSTPSGLNQCTSRSLSSTAASAALVEYVNFTEGFATATKLRYATPTAPTTLESTPGQFINAESQFIPALTTGASTFGTADFATRIRILFAGLPTGTTVYVPTSIGNNVAVFGTAPSETLTLTSTEGSAFSAVAASGTTGASTFAALTATSGAAEAVYEVTAQTAASSTTVEAFSVPVLVIYTAAPGTNSPSLGTSTVQISFAPVSTVLVAAASPIPRFIPSISAVNGFSLSACSTNLLFPFVTNTAGFDTGIAIASTSSDPFGTVLQSGTCKMNFYGTAAPAAFTSPTVTGGTVYATLLSSVAAGFQGYVIAQCNFQYAHGFAFVTDGFGGPGRGLSQGYLPLIIPDTTITGGRGPNPNVVTSGAGEILSN